MGKNEWLEVLIIDNHGHHFNNFKTFENLIRKYHNYRHGVLEVYRYKIVKKLPNILRFVYLSELYSQKLDMFVYTKKIVNSFFINQTILMLKTLNNTRNLRRLQTL